MADSVASEPPLSSLTAPTPSGARRRSSSVSCSAGTVVPCSGGANASCLAWAAIASITGMLPWPRLHTNTPDRPSMYRRPAVSVSRIPSPPTKTSGSFANSRICMKSRKRRGIVCMASIAHLPP